MRPTTSTSPDEVLEPDTIEPATDGNQGTEAKPKTRRKRTAIEQTKARKLMLAESVFQRLSLVALQKGCTVSSVANDLLDRNLPRLSITRDA